MFLKAVDMGVGEDELDELLFMTGEEMGMRLAVWLVKDIDMK